MGRQLALHILSLKQSNLQVHQQTMSSVGERRFSKIIPDISQILLENSCVFTGQLDMKDCFSYIFAFPLKICLIFHDDQ